MKKYWIMLNIVFFFPIYVWAYSNKVIVGGETIGIEIHSAGVYIVGFYPIQGIEIAKDSGFQKGDIITAINYEPVNSIQDLNHILTKEGIYTFEIERNNKQKEIDLPVRIEDDLLKTGLYVKDQINGIGTLSYIDPETRIYGSLGHEILETNTSAKFKLKEGTIYKAEVISIEKSKNGLTGSKNGKFRKEEITGNILANDTQGIFGKYTETYSLENLMEVGEKETIHTGKAYLRTVIEKEKLENFTINILALQEDKSNKNILFEITDEKLLQKTGGIVQGMSGSPIIQDNKIIGVVNYVIVDDTKKGYGIFITTMLEKGDEIIS